MIMERTEKNKLCSKSIAPAFARQILGKEYYEELLVFFVKLLFACNDLTNNNMDYIITVITRRCHVLFEIFFGILRAAVEDGNVLNWNMLELDEASLQKYELNITELHNIDFSKWKCIYQTHLVTDTSLITMGRDFAKYYKEKGAFPKIYIVDELMIHGRALNGVLYYLEEEIKKQYVAAFSIEQKPEEIMQLGQAFQDGVEIRICTAAQNRILLLPRYLKKLTVLKYCDALEWHERSMLYAQLVAKACVSNTAYSWAIYRKGMDMVLNQVSDRGEFRGFQTIINEIRENCYIAIYPDAKHPKAICTVRTKISEGADGNGKSVQMYVPYTVFDHLNLDRIWALHQRILIDVENVDDLRAFLNRYDNRIEENIKNGETVYYRWLCETNELMINALLMIRFLGLYQEERNGLEVDWELLIRNYLPFMVENETEKYDKVRLALEKVKCWAERMPDDTLERYLDVLTAGIPDIWDGDRILGHTDNLIRLAQKEEWIPIIYGVQDAIAEVGYEAERNAYDLASSQTTFSERTLSSWGDNHSISTLLIKCKEHLRPYLHFLNADVDLYQVMSVIIHAMDYGLIGMNPIYTRHPTHDNRSYVQQKKEVYAGQRAGEGSLFILPLRYRQYIPLLENVRKQHGNNYRDAELDIYWSLWSEAKISGKYDADNSESLDILSDELAWFYQMVSQCGQRFSDWRFNCVSDNGGMPAYKQ